MSDESTSSNETDLPAMHRHERGDNSIRGNSAPVANATINDRTSLYLAIIAMVLAALCLGLFLMQTFLMPQIIDAKVAAGVAKAAAEADAARVNSRLALKEVETLCASLKAAAVKNVDCH